MDLKEFAVYALQQLPNWVGFFLPFMVQVLNIEVHKESERYIISVLVCIFIASVIHWHDIAYGDPKTMFSTVGILFVESNTFYTLYFSRSGIRAGLIKLLGGTAQLQEPLEKVEPPIV